nr:MAG TPA: hypothetical protein [Caudoviricetes sp.]
MTIKVTKGTFNPSTANRQDAHEVAAGGIRKTG